MLISPNSGQLRRHCVDNDNDGANTCLKLGAVSIPSQVEPFRERRLISPRSDDVIAGICRTMESASYSDVYGRYIHSTGGLLGHS